MHLIIDLPGQPPRIKTTTLEEGLHDLARLLGVSDAEPEPSGDAEAAYQRLLRDLR